MSVSRRQCTLARPAVVSGFGFWSGQDVRVEFRPAAAGSGRVFVRCDLAPAVRISASAAVRQEVPRRTVLESGGVTVEMVEHVLAAVAGLGIDNCEIWVNAAEMPGCDGSAQEFVAALDRAGITELEAPVEPIVVTRPVRVEAADAWVEARPASHDGLSIEYRLDYGTSGTIGQQNFFIEVTPQSFRRELATCRTFLLESEARLLLSQGLGARVSPRDVLIFADDGPVDNQLRFADECVRHKVLDVVGDLALATRPIQGHVTAHRSGHALNAALVAQLLNPTECSARVVQCA